MKEKQEATGDEFLDFLKANATLLSEVADEEMKISLFDFLKLYSIFIDIDLMIFKSIDIWEATPNERKRLISDLRKQILHKKEAKDNLFMPLIEKYLGEHNASKKD